MMLRRVKGNLLLPISIEGKLLSSKMLIKNYTYYFQQLKNLISNLPFILALAINPKN